MLEIWDHVSLFPPGYAYARTVNDRDHWHSQTKRRVAMLGMEEQIISGRSKINIYFCVRMFFQRGKQAFGWRGIRTFKVGESPTYRCPRKQLCL